MGLLLSGIGSVRQGNFTPDFEIQVLCDIFLIAKCNHMALFVLAVNKGLCATFRTILVFVCLLPHLLPFPATAYLREKIIFLHNPQHSFGIAENILFFQP